MAISKSFVLAALLAYAEARFGQEQEPVAAVQALDGTFGNPGVAATIAGSIPSALLAAASPCDKLTIADQMITELGDDQAVIDAAIGLVAAETNFNPSAVDKPFVCADPALPATAALRGIIPLVDPAVDGAATENANSATSVQTPFDAAGLSQAEDPTIAQGQQEALNPNIITNRICDQLTNVCDASADAVAACEDAQAQIEALGTRDQSTADTWNALLGFAGVDSSQQQV
ncbi:hypothetical protein FGRA07_10895 [Fusarium graminearum]|nr:hypothetical protein FGRA07_10895 [Fusarium graminearum]